MFLHHNEKQRTITYLSKKRMRICCFFKILAHLLTKTEQGPLLDTCTVNKTKGRKITSNRSPGDVGRPTPISPSAAHHYICPGELSLRFSHHFVFHG
jgi:hypothetical protein